MVKVIIPDFIQKKHILNNNILKEICYLSFGDSKFSVEYEKRSNGRYIILTKGNKTHFVCLSASITEYNGRNSFLSQYVSTAFMRFKDLSVKNSKFEVYLLMNSNEAYNNYQTFIYRCCVTLKMRLLNVKKNILPFSNYKEFKNERSLISERNSGNKSTYFSDNGDSIELFAKCYGANGKESAFLAMVLNELTDKKIYVYEVEDHNQKALSASDKKVLKSNGFVFKNNIANDEFKRVNLKSSEKRLRNQPVFKLNLFKKFGDKKCYLCGCDIENLIIASHIHRVTDIKNDPNISDDLKRKQIVDGDNGFWLCANHDKLFEYGLIYFDNKKMVVSKILNKEQKQFVDKITILSNRAIIKNHKYKLASFNIDNFTIEDNIYNTNMKKYLELHRKRVTQ